MAEEKKVTNGMNLVRTGRRVVTIGAVGSTYMIASDQVVDGWFQDSAGMDSSKNAPYYRAGAQGLGGILLGAATWKMSRDVAMGFMAGGGVGAGLRVSEELELSKKLRDLVDGTGDGTRRVTRPYVAPVTGTPARLTAGRAAAGLHDDGGWSTVDNVTRLVR